MTAIYYYSQQIGHQPIIGQYYSHKKMGRIRSSFDLFLSNVWIEIGPIFMGSPGIWSICLWEDVKRWQAKTGLSLQISGDKCPRGPFWHPNRYLVLSELCHKTHNFHKKKDTENLQKTISIRNAPLLLSSTLILPICNINQKTSFRERPNDSCCCVLLPYIIVHRGIRAASNEVWNLLLLLLA